METPKSVTAIVHLRFNYKDKDKDGKEIQGKPVGEGELETLNKLMDQAYDLPVDLQEILVKFGSYLKVVSSGDGGAEPKEN